MYLRRFLERKNYVIWCYFQGKQKCAVRKSSIYALSWNFVLTFIVFYVISAEISWSLLISAHFGIAVEHSEHQLSTFKVCSDRNQLKFSLSIIHWKLITVFFLTLYDNRMNLSNRWLCVHSSFFENLFCVNSQSQESHSAAFNNHTLCQKFFPGKLLIEKYWGITVL